MSEVGRAVKPSGFGFTDRKLDVLVKVVDHLYSRLLVFLNSLAGLDFANLILILFVYHLCVTDETAFSIIFPDLVLASELLVVHHFEKVLLLTCN